MMLSALFLDQHTELDFYSASTLRQHSAGWHLAPLEHNFILIPSQPVFKLLLLLNAECSAEKQHIPIL